LLINASEHMDVHDEEKTKSINYKFKFMLLILEIMVSLHEMEHVKQDDNSKPSSAQLVNLETIKRNPWAWELGGKANLHKVWHSQVVFRVVENSPWLKNDKDHLGHKYKSKEYVFLDDFCSVEAGLSIQVDNAFNFKFGFDFD